MANKVIAVETDDQISRLVLFAVVNGIEQYVPMALDPTGIWVGELPLAAVGFNMEFSASGGENVRKVRLSVGEDEKTFENVGLVSFWCHPLARFTAMRWQLGVLKFVD